MGFKSVMKKIGKVASIAAPIVAAPFTGGASLALIGAGAGAAHAKLSGKGLKGVLGGAALGAIPGVGKVAAAGKLGGAAATAAKAAGVGGGAASTGGKIADAAGKVLEQVPLGKGGGAQPQSPSYRTPPFVPARQAVSPSMAMQGPSNIGGMAQQLAQKTLAKKAPLGGRQTTAGRRQLSGGRTVMGRR